jgi:hypothetical protein
MEQAEPAELDTELEENCDPHVMCIQSLLDARISFVREEQQTDKHNTCASNQLFCCKTKGCNRQHSPVDESRRSRPLMT